MTATIDVDFIWHRASSYELGVSARGKVIRQKGRLAPYSPLRLETLPLHFAKLDGSPKACLDFATRFGFLETVPGAGDEESVSDWRHSIMLVRGWVEMIAAGNLALPGLASNSLITTVDVLVGYEPSGARRLVLRPRALLNAMLLQLAQSSAIATCQQCGQWFEVGAAGKRVVAKFCSDKCRNRFNYERRAEK